VALAATSCEPTSHCLAGWDLLASAPGPRHHGGRSSALTRTRSDSRTGPAGRRIPISTRRICPRINAHGGAGRCAGLAGRKSPVNLFPGAVSGSGHRASAKRRTTTSTSAHRGQIELRPGAAKLGDNTINPWKITGTVIKLSIIGGGAAALHRAHRRGCFGQMRFDRTYSYAAEFRNVSGLRNGQFVRRLRGGDRQKSKNIKLVDNGSSGCGWTSTSTARCRCTSPRQHRSAIST